MLRSEVLWFSFIVASLFTSCSRKAPELREAQSDIHDAPSVERADQLAAHPADPTKPKSMAGVSDEQLASPEIIERAADACIEAVEKNPDEPRCRFELGRVLVLGGLIDEGREHLEAAAAMGSGGAYFYLGKLEDDFDKAKALFQKAVSAGFKPAEDMLTQLSSSAPTSDDKKASTKSALPLHDQRVTRLEWHALGPISEVPEFSRDIVSTHIDQIQNSEQRILVCSYGDPKTDFETYYFWYEKPPSNLAAVIEGISTHPLRALGFKGYKTAPANSEEAMRMAREAQQQR